METIAVTGGNGRIGMATLRHLSQRGYDTVNLSRGSRREQTSDQYIKTDLLNPGAVYGALAHSGVDGVIHFATIPNPRNNPGFETYESNVMSAYYILEASEMLGLDSVVLPSSINVLGAAWQDAPIDIEYLPVDECHPSRPCDPYGLAKQAMENTADGVGNRTPSLTISSLRLPWVRSSDDMKDAIVPTDRVLENVSQLDPHTTKDALFSYLHIKDAAAVAFRAVTATHAGHERFWAVADDTTMQTPSKRLIQEIYSDAEVRDQIIDRDALISISKASESLGWSPDHSWRDLF